MQVMRTLQSKLSYISRRRNICTFAWKRQGYHDMIYYILASSKLLQFKRSSYWCTSPTTSGMVSMKIADINMAALQQANFPTIQGSIKQALIESVWLRMQLIAASAEGLAPSARPWLRLIGLQRIPRFSTSVLRLSRCQGTDVR